MTSHTSALNVDEFMQQTVEKLLQIKSLFGVLGCTDWGSDEFRPLSDVGCLADLGADAAYRLMLEVDEFAMRLHRESED